MGVPIPAYCRGRTFIEHYELNNPLKHLQHLLDHWKQDENTAPNFSAWKTTPPRAAQTHPFPTDLPAQLRETLSSRNIHQLYSHQLSAWTSSRAGKNIILATSTASGKTLAYNLPVLAAMIQNPEARAIYLFPTKALAQDQLSTLTNLKPETWNLTPAIYDGDTPQSQRSAIRKNARIVLSNPDMLHTGILPHHSNWSDFFSNLEIHRH